MRNCNISQLTRELYGKHIVLYHTIHRTLLATQMSSCVIFIPDNFIIENPVIIYHQWLLPHHIFNAPLSGPSIILLYTPCIEYNTECLFITPDLHNNAITVYVVCIKDIARSLHWCSRDCVSYLFIYLWFRFIYIQQDPFTDAKSIMRLPWWVQYKHRQVVYYGINTLCHIGMLPIDGYPCKKRQNGPESKSRQLAMPSIIQSLLRQY